MKWLLNSSFNNAQEIDWPMPNSIESNTFINCHHLFASLESF
jgi:hypothetical protein